MTQPCRILEWDSQFFSRRIARINEERLNKTSVTEIFCWVSARQIDCLYFLCRADDDESVKLAEENGFHLVDIKYELNWRVQEERFTTANAARELQETDLPMLLQMASEIYTDTRFYYDQHFPRSQVSNLYQQWVAQSCSDKAQKIFVVPVEGEPIGFITCGFDNPNIGRIGLLGVGSASKGRGYGQALVDAAQQYFRQRQASEVRVVTQGRNIAAQRLYQSCGFRAQAIRLWYHKWFI